MKKFYENKFVWIISIVLIFGIVSVLANIGEAGYSGIQVDNYYTGSGQQGITQNITMLDKDSNNHFFIFEDGLLVNYSIVGPNPFDGLVAYYKLDETSGNALDATGNGYTGNNSGVTEGATGIINNSYNFIPSSHVESQIEAFSISEDMSYSFWIKPADSGVDRTIVDIGKGTNAFQIVVYLQNNGQIVFQTSNRDVANGVTVTGGTTNISLWTYVAATYSAESKAMTLYVNGINVANGTATATDVTGSAGFLIGASYYGSSINNNNNFNGTIDEVGIWNRVLSSSEIEALYNNGNGLAYY